IPTIHHIIFKLLHHVILAIEVTEVHVLLQRNLTLASCQALLLFSVLCPVLRL
ncbi:Os01g0366100, partial [Oryza sativa Japonica Group]